MPEQTPAAATQRPPGQPGQGGQPPFGVSPASGPTPNKGLEAAALQRLGSITKQLTELLSLSGAMSDVGKVVLEVLPKLTKLVPPGSVSPASEKNHIEQMQMKNTQQNSQMQALKAQQMQQAGQGGGGQPPAQMPRAA